MDDKVQFGDGGVVSDLAGVPVRHRHHEVLLHAAVKPWDALQVERLGAGVDHRAVLG